MIFEKVESLFSLVVFTSIKPFLFNVPAKTVSPLALKAGRGSPVMEVS
jgi:hypothetical protein